jgi:dolichol-phosphate mannosyltransferase
MLEGSQPIVVTGCSGFVGANLVRHFAAKGARVIGVEGPNGIDWRTRGVANVEFAKVDLCNEADVKAFIRAAKPKAVLNCAAYGAYSNQRESNRIYRVNLDGVRFMLEALRECPDFRAFVQAGTSSEYGLNCSGPSEEDPTTPDSDYAVSKVAATALVKCYAMKYGVPGWILRLYSVYGPYEDFSRLMPQLLLKARHKELPPLVNPRISRDFVYVDDVSRAFATVVSRADRLKPGQIYNIGAGARVTLDDLVGVVRSTFDIAKKPDWGTMPDRHWDHPDWFSNPRKAEIELEWKGSTTLVEGLRATMRWIESHPDQVREGQEHTVTAVKS